jgi:hypothetical protein
MASLDRGQNPDVGIAFLSANRGSPSLPAHWGILAAPDSQGIAAHPPIRLPHLARDRQTVAPSWRRSLLWVSHRRSFQRSLTPADRGRSPLPLALGRHRGLLLQIGGSGFPQSIGGHHSTSTCQLAPREKSSLGGKAPLRYGCL